MESQAGALTERMRLQRIADNARGSAGAWRIKAVAGYQSAPRGQGHRSARLTDGETSR
jgi:hypothetical protein